MFWSRLTNSKTFQRISAHSLTALLSGTVVFLGMVSAGTESLAKIEQFIHPAPTSLQLANQTAQGEFSRQISHDAWERLFWIRVYQKRVTRGASDAESDQAWGKYVDAELQWNRDYITNLQALQQFYPGQDKYDTYLHKIQPQFQTINSQMDDIRYPRDKTLGFNHGPVAPTLEKNINTLNDLLFDFMTQK